MIIPQLIDNVLCYTLVTHINFTVLFLKCTATDISLPKEHNVTDIFCVAPKTAINSTHFIDNNEHTIVKFIILKNYTTIRFYLWERGRHIDLQSIKIHDKLNSYTLFN